MDDSQAAAAITTATSKAPKSPPLAFQMTSNDSLVAPVYSNHQSQMAFQSPQYIFSPGTQQKLEYQLDDPMQQELQAQIQKQAEALRLQHQAFAVERECWDLERDRLYRRVMALESLLKAANGHSPARSPVTSPYSGALSSQIQQSQFQSHTSPLARPSTTSTTSRLPSIVEDESSAQSPQVERPVSSLSRQSSINRRAAPKHIQLPGGHQIPTIDGNVELGEQAFNTSAMPSAGPEVPMTPPATRNTLSPPPAEYRTNAGHTPLKVPARPLALHSPARSTFSEPSTDTPTRNNTELNANLADEKDEDEALKGPLHMPELPATPSDVEENFTIHALTARLRHIEEHPEENEPLALQARCNRRDSVPDVNAGAQQKTTLTDSEGFRSGDDDLERKPSEGLSTISEERIDSTIMTSPPNVPTDEPDLDRGIKLKKKASCNFGTPFGQLGPRKF